MRLKLRLSSCIAPLATTLSVVGAEELTLQIVTQIAQALRAIPYPRAELLMVRTAVMGPQFRERPLVSDRSMQPVTKHRT